MNRLLNDFKYKAGKCLTSNVKEKTGGGNKILKKRLVKEFKNKGGKVLETKGKGKAGGGGNTLLRAVKDTACYTTCGCSQGKV